MRQLTALLVSLAVLAPLTADAKPRTQRAEQSYSAIDRAVRLGKARKAAKRAAERLAHLEAVEACIAERTSPDGGGMPEEAAVAVCEAETE